MLPVICGQQIAQIDPRAALAVKSLAENDYNMLIASVGNHSDSAMLDAAIGALKDAPDDEALFEKYPEARQEFAEIDEDADTFDPSLKNIVKMGLKYLKNS